MYENYDGAHLLARRVAMAVSGWPLLTRKWILTKYMMKSNISDSFVKSFKARPWCTIWFCFKLVVGGVVSSLPVFYFQGFPEDEWRRRSAVNVWNLWIVLYPRSFLRDFQLHRRYRSITIMFCSNGFDFCFAKSKVLVTPPIHEYDS